MADPPDAIARAKAALDNLGIGITPRDDEEAVRLKEYLERLEKEEE